MHDNIPCCLLQLTKEDINTLRPFYLFLEEHERPAHGYHIKCSTEKLRMLQQSIVDKIAALSDEDQKARCESAYNYLITSDTSKHAHFVALRQKLIEENSDLNVLNFRDTEGIECALWPNLYPYTSWCESVISDARSRLSRKVSFITKLYSEIIDYALDFELLQFQYDRWLYKTVTGAINTARRLKCSPARALDTKMFSSTYWQCQHRYVLVGLSNSVCQTFSSQ